MTKFLTVEDVTKVCEKHGLDARHGTTAQAILVADLDKAKSLSDIEDQLIEAGVLTGEKEFRPLVKEFYEGGECPDCGDTIPDDATSGEECSNCGHVFWTDKDVEEVPGDTIQVIVGNMNESS